MGQLAFKRTDIRGDGTAGVATCLIPLVVVTSLPVQPLLHQLYNSTQDYSMFLRTEDT